MESKFKVGEEVCILTSKKAIKTKIKEIYHEEYNHRGTAYSLEESDGYVRYEDGIYTKQELLKMIEEL